VASRLISGAYKQVNAQLPAQRLEDVLEFLSYRDQDLGLVGLGVFLLGCGLRIAEART